MINTPAVLPFEPEPIEQLRARFPAAIERTWDLRGCVHPDDVPSERPGQFRAHVFDIAMPDYMRPRIIISRDWFDWFKRPVLHASLSLRYANGQPYTKLPEPSIHSILVMFIQWMQTISGQPIVPTDTDIEHGVLHMIYASEEPFTNENEPCH
jgi:hypothetical protein